MKVIKDKEILQLQMMYEAFFRVNRCFSNALILVVARNDGSWFFAKSYNEIDFNKYLFFPGIMFAVRGEYKNAKSKDNCIDQFIGNIEKQLNERG